MESRESSRDAPPPYSIATVLCTVQNSLYTIGSSNPLGIGPPCSITRQGLLPETHSNAVGTSTEIAKYASAQHQQSIRVKYNQKRGYMVLVGVFLFFVVISLVIVLSMIFA
ncbi:hypothetical protein PPYR_10185 [Photinus pyralis]|uniref:Uncharacterized protein n=1 Tax=Photinus pyralis TaxID=7054 RepID=A0A5N4AFN4_PHOPY|nr:hypothetical protein PPYR_10185 [Photinus pyralis]